MDKINRHKEICENLNKIYTAKNRDYGDSFSEGFQEYGLIMPAIRFEDKLRRYKQLMKQAAEVKDESIVDTLLDLANYAIMTVMEIEDRAEDKERNEG